MELEAKNKVISWINEVFDSRNFSKLDIEFPEYDNKGGYVAEMIYTNVIGHKNGEKELFELVIKQSKNNTFLLDTLNLRQAYRNELNIFSKILPYLQALATKYNSAHFENIPRCYGTIAKDDDYVVIMENLKVSGYRTNELTKPQDLDHVKLVLQAYAKWHALCLAAAEKNPNIFKEMGNFNPMREGSKGFEIMTQTMFKELDSTIEMYKDKGKPHITEKLIIIRKRIVQLFIDSMDTMNENYLVFRHGDCWNNNFMFHYNEGETKPNKVVIIDWQLSAPASPLCDVAQYLFYSTSRQELEHMDELLKLYHDNVAQKLNELGCNPEQTFPWEACLQSFKKYVMIGVAGVPMCSKLNYEVDPTQSYDLSQTEKDGDMTGLFAKPLSDPEGYFKKVDNVFELCYERGYF